MRSFFHAYSLALKTKKLPSNELTPCSCADLRTNVMGGPNAICKQDKAFMPPSGTTAGTVSDVYRPAALRLRGPTLFEPAKGLVGRIRRSRQANVVKKGITRRPFSLCRAA